MAVDIYKRKDTKNRLFQITDKLYDFMAKSILEKFEKATGVYIDNYGIQMITFQHLQLLRKILQDELNQKDKKFPKEAQDFLFFLTSAIGNELDLDFVGD
jgi:hypothetical protein